MGLKLSVKQWPRQSWFDSSHIHQIIKGYSMKQKKNRTICSKRTANSIYGKATINGKTRWRFRLFDGLRVSEISYRKSKFKTLDQFETFLKGKRWI